MGVLISIITRMHIRRMLECVAQLVDHEACNSRIVGLIPMDHPNIKCVHALDKGVC